jgi:hypothetical protein
VAYRDPQRAFLLNRFENVVEPQILGTVDVAGPLGDELDVDRLDDVVADVCLDPFDAASAAGASRPRKKGRWRPDTGDRNAPARARGRPLRSRRPSASSLTKDLSYTHARQPP